MPAKDAEFADSMDQIAVNLGWVAQSLGEVANALVMLAQATASQYAGEEEEEAGPKSLSDR